MKIMKPRYLFMAFILAVCTVLSGCTNDNVSSDSEGRVSAFMDSRVFQKHTAYNVKAVEQMPFSEIVEIAADNEYIYYLDRAMNCIHVSDTKGQLLQRIGSVGNAAGELLNPTAFAVTEEGIHVADSGNRRIQVFDKKGKALDALSLSFLPELAECNGLGYTGDGYIVSVVPKDKGPTVYFVKKDNSVVPLAKNTQGTIAVGNKSAFFVESDEFFNNSEGHGFKTGKNMVYQFNDGELKKIDNKFAYGYSISRGSHNYKGKWYAFSTSYSSIDMFDKEWNYEETVLDLSKFLNGTSTFFDSSFAMNNSGQMFVFSPKINRLLIISQSNEK